MRWSMTEDEQKTVAGMMVETLETHNRRIEQGPPREDTGRG
jgi:hypothetical protein